MRLALAWFLAVILFASPSIAHPPIIAPRGATPENVDTIGVEGASDFAPLEVELNYAHRFPALLVGHAFTMYNALATPAAALTEGSQYNITRDVRATLGASALALRRTGWNVGASAFIDVDSAKSSVGTIFGPAFELRALPGYYGARGFIALDVGLHMAPWAVIKNSQQVFSMYADRYPPGVVGIAGPKDGLYAFLEAPSFECGVAGEIRIWRVAIYGELGEATNREDALLLRLGIRAEL